MKYEDDDDNINDEDETCENDDSTSEHLKRAGICESEPNILHTGGCHVTEGRGEEHLHRGIIII